MEKRTHVFKSALVAGLAAWAIFACVVYLFLNHATAFGVTMLAAALGAAGVKLVIDAKRDGNGILLAWILCVVFWILGCKILGV